jgi:hypothetical protein
MQGQRMQTAKVDGLEHSQKFAKEEKVAEKLQHTEIFGFRTNITALLRKMFSLCVQNV